MFYLLYTGDNEKLHFVRRDTNKKDIIHFMYDITEDKYVDEIVEMSALDITLVRFTKYYPLFKEKFPEFCI